MWRAVHRGAALHTNAHATQRRARLTADGCAAGFAGRDQGGSHAGAVRNLNSPAIHGDVEGFGHTGNLYWCEAAYKMNAI